MKLPIIMCTWMRPDGFARVIQQLNEQTFKEFHLYVWNNNFGRSKEFETIAKAAEFGVTFYHSESNIGGFGRFYSAKSLYEKDKTANACCVFLDDDNVFDKDAIATLWSERAPNTIVSHYGWRFKSAHYYDRYQPEPGESVDYAGTGGMIADASIFCKNGLYSCPEQYWAVEDLWLSYCAKTHYGYSLIRSAAKMTQKDDNASLNYSIAESKIEMLDILVGQMNFKISK